MPVPDICRRDRPQRLFTAIRGIAVRVSAKRVLARQLHWVPVHVVAQHRHVGESDYPFRLQCGLSKNGTDDDISQKLQRLTQSRFWNRERPAEAVAAGVGADGRRSEERRVGKECRWRWAPEA